MTDGSERTGTRVSALPEALTVLIGAARRRRSTGIVLGGMVVQQSFAFLTGIVVAHAIGATGFGTSNILRNILAAALTLAPVGLDLALLKYGPRFADGRVFARQLGRLRLLVAVVNVTAVLIGWGLLGGWLERSVYRIAGFRELLLITLVALPIAADLAVMNAVYKVEGQPARYALMSTWLQPPIRLAGGVLALLLGWGVEAIVVTTTLSYAATALCVAVDRMRRRAAPAPAPAARPAEENEAGAQTPVGELAGWGGLGTILRDSAWMAVSLFAYGALRFVDVLVLGAWRPPAVVGAYAALGTISQLVAFYPLAMSQTLGPDISRHYHAGDLRGVHRALDRYIRSASLAGGFILGGVAAFGDHLDLVFGRSFHFDPLLALLLPLGWFVSATLSPTSYALSLTGHHRAELVVLLTGTAVLVAGCLLLVPALGAVGAAVAVLVTFLTIDVSRSVMVLRNLHFVPGHLGDLLPPIVAVALGYGVKLAADAALGRSFPALVGSCGVYALLFCGLGYALYRQPRADG